MNETSFRNGLEELLKGESAHVSAKDALEGLAAKNRAVRPEGVKYSVWELFEHMRISQEDILRYTLDPQWRSPKWPEGYWPKPASEVSDAEWKTSIKKFFADLDEMRRLTTDPKIDLTSKIPHGGEHTYLREILLVADHNAYHTGQIVTVRKLLGDWKR
ncbi:MAG: DinB family protein [Acidobacteriia bacterium]|nr:DinB family protein [Terriglobia bacterium]